MINPDEQILVVDENNKPVGLKSRKEAHEQGLWHRVSHVWIFNDAGEVLCQKRSLKKDNKPGLWEPFLGGHNDTEDYVAGAVKEVSEEIGLQTSADNYRQFMTWKIESSHHFSAVLVAKWNGTVDQLKPEADEIDELAWHDPETIRFKVIEEQDPDWVPYLGYEDKLLDWAAKAK